MNAPAFSSDASLFELGRRWTIAAAQYDAATDRRDTSTGDAEERAANEASNEANAAEEALRAQIAQATATTLDGIMVKVRAVSWSYGDNLASPIAEAMERGDGGLGEAIMLTIARDLLAMHGTGDTSATRPRPHQIADRLSDARRLLDAAWMAAHAGEDPRQRDALCALLDVIGERLASLSEDVSPRHGDK